MAQEAIAAEDEPGGKTQKQNKVAGTAELFINSLLFILFIMTLRFYFLFFGSTILLPALE